jgi:hypothetical protein
MRGKAYSRRPRPGRAAPHGLALVLALVSFAAVVDRVAVVVGNQVITETELLEEVRVTEFLNGEPLDLGPDQRRAAAERLVDQELIRRDMEIGGYAQPSAEEGAKMLGEFRKERYPSDAPFQAALDQYGITEDELKQHLLWQLAVMRFTEARFRPLVAPEQDTRNADRMRPGAEASDGDSVERQMEAWLKETRAGVRIQFKKEAFQ